MTTPFNDAQLRWLLDVIQTSPAVDGVDGPQGPQGDEGSQGPQGPLQADGAQGPQGAAGPTGPQGRPGSDGRTGEDGESVTGAQGPQGVRGATGSRGPQGNDGDDGPQGKAGKNGSPGASGFGPQGAQGAAGGGGDGFEPYGPDLVTGDNQTFLASLGDWQESAGTLLWTDIGPAFFHPVNPTSTHILDWLPAANDDYVELTVPGPFLAGVPYVAILAVSENTGDTSNWQMDFGVVGVDTETSSQKFHTGLIANNHLVSVLWMPATDQTDPVVRFTYQGAGSPELNIGWCKVAEIRDYPAFRSLDITDGRGSWMRFQDRHFSIVNEDFLVHAVDVVNIVGGEEVTLTNLDGPVVIEGDELTVANIGFDGNILVVARDPGTLVLSGFAGVTIGSDDGGVAVHDGVGLESAARPAIATQVGIVDVAAFNLLRTALISLGVILDGD